MSADTRINIKLKSDTETEINGLGPALTNEEIQELKQAVSRVQAGDIVVLQEVHLLLYAKDFTKN